MFLLAASQAYRSLLKEFDAGVLTGEQCAELVAELARAEKACAAVRMVAAKRAADCQAHRQRGFRDAADWLAREMGSTRGTARNTLEHADAIESCAVVRDAAIDGDLSLAQAFEIVETEEQVPGSADTLVALAKSESLPVLRDAARKRRLEAMDVEALHAKQHDERRVRRWTNEFGMRCGSWQLPPAEGIAFENRLDAETDRIRRGAAPPARPIRASSTRPMRSSRSCSRVRGEHARGATSKWLSSSTATTTPRTSSTAARSRRAQRGPTFATRSSRLSSGRANGLTPCATSVVTDPPSYRPRSISGLTWKESRASTAASVMDSSGTTWTHSRTTDRRASRM